MILNIKFWLSIMAILVLTLLVSGIEIWHLKGDVSKAQADLKAARTQIAFKDASLAVKEADLQVANSKIDLQNIAIKQLEVSKPDIQKIKKEIETKFERIKPPQKVKTKETKCEAELVYYQDLFRELGDD